MGANAHTKGLTVAGCNINGRVVGYSSRGPGIAGMAREKPDLAAFTHYLGSEVLGVGQPDGGTSAAAPLVGGIIAALRGKHTPKSMPPEELYRRLRQSAAKSGAKTWDPGLGFGVVDWRGLLTDAGS